MIFITFPSPPLNSPTYDRILRALYLIPYSHDPLGCILPTSDRRRIAWNATLVVGGVFGICAAAAPNFVVFCTFIALIGKFNLDPR